MDIAAYESSVEKILDAGHYCAEDATVIKEMLWVLTGDHDPAMSPPVCACEELLEWYLTPESSRLVSTLLQFGGLTVVGADDQLN